MSPEKIGNSNAVTNNSTKKNEQKFNPESDDTLYSIFEKVTNGDPTKAKDVNYEELSRATMIATDYYNDLDANKNGVFEEGEIKGDIKNYANQKDGKFQSTSFADIAANVYNKLTHKNNTNGERVETHYQGDSGEYKSYYDKENKLIKRESRENGVLVSEFEFPNDKTENGKEYEADGKTIKSTFSRITEGNKKLQTDYDKAGNITSLYERITEKQKDGTSISTETLKDATGTLKEKNENITKPDGSSIYRGYDGNGKLLKQATITLDANGDWKKTVTDGEGKPLKEE